MLSNNILIHKSHTFFIISDKIFYSLRFVLFSTIPPNPISTRNFRETGNFTVAYLDCSVALVYSKRDTIRNSF